MASIPRDLRDQLHALTGRGFESCSSQEELIIQLAKANGLLKARNNQLSTRIFRVQKAYEFAKLEANSWRAKAEQEKAV